MGEVYRADDLRLGQQVALKLLPESLRQDPARLAQFHNEVRTARQVSHPNVCRVYDIGESEGFLYLSMEYVDGEDLASSLRRIGRFPEDKAIAIARQLCAGVAAAHQRGIVHRDLKPANVMLDGTGAVRVMDFGLAAVGQVEDIRAGTPGYMAPEQLLGREVTTRSDIFALGLVIYELFTGRRAFNATSIGELVSQHETGTITRPSAVIGGISQAIERAILRCLESDPAKRPATALAVSAALPGGDPLAAMLAAGETPSPELVAAAGEGAGLSPRVAWTLYASIIAGIDRVLRGVDSHQSARRHAAHLHDGCAGAESSRRDSSNRLRGTPCRRGVRVRVERGADEARDGDRQAGAAVADRAVAAPVAAGVLVPSKQRFADGHRISHGPPHARHRGPGRSAAVDVRHDSTGTGPRGATRVVRDHPAAARRETDPESAG